MKIEQSYEILQNATKHQPKCWFNKKDKQILTEQPLMDHQTMKEIDVLGVGFNFVVNDKPILIVVDMNNTKGISLIRLLQKTYLRMQEKGMALIPTNIEHEDINQLEVWLPIKIQLSKGRSESVYEADNFVLTDNTNYANKTIEALEMMSDDEPQPKKIEQKYDNPLELLDDKIWKPVKKEEKENGNTN